MTVQKIYLNTVNNRLAKNIKGIPNNSFNGLVSSSNLIKEMI